MIKLPLAELKVMKVIWESNKEKISSKEIIDVLKEMETWKRTTVLTLLSRLTQKGFITSKKDGRVTIYTKIIDKEDYSDFATSEFMKNIHNNSIESLINSLKRDKDIQINSISGSFQSLN